MKGVCTVLTDDGGIKHFGAHEPLLLAPGTPLNLLLHAPPQPGHQSVVRLRVCTRCDSTYLDGIERDFTKGADAPPTPAHWNLT